MKSELESKLNQLGEAVEAFKKTTDRIDALEKKVGHAPADYKEMQEKTNNAISEIQNELKEVKAAAARGITDPKVEKEQEKELQSKAVQKFLRYGKNALTQDDIKLIRLSRDEEGKALSVDSDQDGGFLVAPTLSNEIVTKQFETSPMRQIASQITISGNAYEILEDLDEAEVVEAGETEKTGTTRTPQLKQIVITAHEMRAAPLASQTILEDAAINMEAWLSEKLADKFGRKENLNFMRGDGVGKARGILSYANGTGFEQIEQIESAAASVLSADDILSLIYSLKSAYRKQGVMLATRSSIGLMRKLKDQEGRYLWAPGLNGDQEETIAGKRLEEFADMDEVGAGKLALAFGDFKQGYQIVDRLGISVIRDIYTKKPFVEFYTRKRSGGGVKNFEAFKLLKVKAP